MNSSIAAAAASGSAAAAAAGVELLCKLRGAFSGSSSNSWGSLHAWEVKL